jgi:phosphoglycolate phosphatase
MKKYKLVIFDWDGTLMDSVGRIVSSMRSAAAQANLNIPSEEAVKNIIGLSLPEATDILFPLCTEQQARHLLVFYKEHYVTHDTTPSPLFNHAISLLQQLKDNQQLLAVATGKGRNGLERVMAETDTKAYFNASKCADESESKPSPDMVLQLLEQLNINPQEAVMIGDTVHDMAMARSAGIDRIGVTMGVHDRESLSEFQPIAVVDSLAELEPLLLK